MVTRAGKDVEKRNPYTLMVKSVNLCNSLWKTVYWLLIKTEHRFVCIWSTKFHKFHYWEFIREKWNQSVKTSALLHLLLHYSQSPRMGTTYVSVGQWVNKEKSVHIYAYAQWNTVLPLKWCNLVIRNDGYNWRLLC